MGATGRSIPWGAALPWPLKGPWSRARRATRSSARAAAQARFGGDDDRHADWATVYRASGIEEAYVIRGALLAEGIPAVVTNQALPRIYGSAMVWGIEVQVPCTLVDRAQSLLAEED